MDERDLELREIAKALDNLDDTLEQVSNVLLDGTPPVEERRRYALLHAAAAIFINERAEVRQLLASATIEEKDVIDACVGWAESLLAEIEKRQKAEGES